MGAPSTFPLPRKARPQVRPEINVTPLVDVVLVLLIIFMVIAPQLESGDRVELPAIANPDKTAKLDALTLTVTASERYLLEKVPVEAADLGKELARAHPWVPGPFQAAAGAAHDPAALKALEGLGYTAGQTIDPAWQWTCPEHMDAVLDGPKSRCPKCQEPPLMIKR